MSWPDAYHWEAHAGFIPGDGRPQAVRPVPCHALTHDERAQLLAVANQPRFASVSHARMVPMLADEGLYLASEFSFSQVLREHGQSTPTGPRQGAQGLAPTDHAHRHRSAPGPAGT